MDNLASILPKDRDEDTLLEELVSVNIELVQNGYIVTYIYDEQEVKEVYIDKKDLLTDLSAII